MYNVTFRCRGEHTSLAQSGAHGHDTAGQFFNGDVPVRSAIIADKERGVGALFAEPGVRSAESHSEVKGSTVVFRDRGTEGAISWRRNIFPMFPAIRAAIGAFTTGGDNQSFGFRAGENLVDVGIIQPFSCCSSTVDPHRR